MENKYKLSNASKFVKSDKLCRICLTENASQTTCLHEARPDCPLESLASMVMAVARVEIHSQDGLPATICGDCLGELEAAHGFRLKCERSDELLRKLFPKELADDILQRIPDSAVISVKGENPQFVKLEFDNDFNSDSNDISNINYLIESDASNEFLKQTTKRKSKKHSKIKKGTKSSSHEDVKDDSLAVKIELDVNNDSSCINSVEASDGNEKKINVIKIADENVKEKLNNARPFVCDECGRPMSSKKSLEHHKHCMHGEKRRQRLGKVTGYGPSKRFHCLECPYNTPLRRSLQFHTRTHSGDKPYQCQVCPARFAQPGPLKAHSTRHSDVMHFTCPICGKQFKLKCVYERHKLVHSDARPHICTICNKGLKTKKSLAIHTKRHLNIRDYSCHECGATFVSLASLINHSKSHIAEKNFECNICGFRSRYKSKLVDHVKRHTLERTFKCDLCDYAAVEKSSLKMHMKKHTREKKYACPICDLKMIYSTSVNNHMLRLHGIRYRVNDYTDRRILK